jgi:hypothetical protein
MARVNIVIQSELLEAIDRAALEDNLSRSGLLQEAARAYLERRREERAAAERKARMEKAAGEMDRLAEKFGKWDGVEMVRKFRDSRSEGKA